MSEAYKFTLRDAIIVILCILALSTALILQEWRTEQNHQHLKNHIQAHCPELVEEIRVVRALNEPKNYELNITSIANK